MHRLAACQSLAAAQCLLSCRLAPLLRWSAKLVSSLRALWHDPQPHNLWLYPNQLHQELSSGRRTSPSQNKRPVYFALSLSKYYS